MAQAQLTWYGHAAFKIVTPGGKILLIDPWLDNPKNPNGERDLASLDRVDFIVLTHGHSDHVGNTVQIGKRTGAKLVAGLDLARAVTKVLGYPSNQAEMDTTGLFGGEVPLPGGEITTTMVPAFHGGGIGKDDDTLPVFAGAPSGMIIALRDGPTFYHTGDTDLFSDMALVSRYHKIDAMMVCMGDHFTMGPKRAADAVKLVGPRMVIPMHYGTFPVLTGTPEAFDRELKVREVAADLRVMKVGETISL